MPDPASASLPTLLSAAAALAGSERTNAAHAPRDVAELLHVRLARCYEILREEGWESGLGKGGDAEELRVLQEATARAALRLLEGMQDVLEPGEYPPTGTTTTTTPPPPLLGTRDLSHVRTLLSLIFNWAVAPLMADEELAPHDSSPAPAHTPADPRGIIDLTDRGADDDDGLPGLTLRILALPFGAPATTAGALAHGGVRQTWITAALLARHAADVLRPGLVVGCAPGPQRGEAPTRRARDVRALVMRFVNLLRPHEAIAALGTVLASAVSAKRPSSRYVAAACRRLLGDQLMRPDGVSGLCVAVFGEEAEAADVAPLDKLEHVAKVLCTVPAAANAQDYYQAMIPRILALLRPSSEAQGNSPPSHKRAAAFALSRMLSATFQNHAITSAILLPLLHTPFVSPSLGTESEEAAPRARPAVRLTAAEALQTLQTFLLHADPSPTELARLLTPIAPELYTLLALHRPGKTAADPRLRESLAGLLQTWGRIVSVPDAIDGLWRIISGAGGHWELRLDGFSRSAIPVPSPGISLLAVAELEASSKEDVDINANPFNLRPDPSEFVAFLKTMNRSDVASEIFVKLLNEYRELNDSEEQPMRTLLYLQLVLQMQAQLRTTVLSKPEHVLSFIKHALASSAASLRPSGLADESKFKKGLGLKDLRIVEEEEEGDVSGDGDSDDDEEDAGAAMAGIGGAGGGGRHEMGVTAITLLLSILEANADLSPHNAPDLNDILSSLDRVASHASPPTMRQLAREARLVLTARTAAQSATASAAGAPRARRETESAQATYQQALRLLQDPIIPVRAHGLHLLRELVSRPSSKTSPPHPDEARLDPALLPGVLSIFLQAIQDDESYIFLNAVQGLAAMVDGYGREVLRGIVDVYLSGTGVGSSGIAGGGITMSKEELDARLRVGEALNTAVKRCGGALGLYVDILVPPLLTVLRSSHLPTTLRTSALSILAQCTATNALALSAYGTNLTDACVELIQLESVPLKSTTGQSRVHDSSSVGQNRSTAEGNESRGGGERESLRQPDLMDSEPTTTMSKAAPLRRAALHFLSQVLRSHLTSVSDSRSSSAAVPTVSMSIGVSRPRDLPTTDGTISDVLLKRAGVVLGYVAATDEDAVTRVMAREASELVEQYRQASLGF